MVHRFLFAEPDVLAGRAWRLGATATTVRAIGSDRWSALQQAESVVYASHRPLQFSQAQHLFWSRSFLSHAEPQGSPRA